MPRPSPEPAARSDRAGPALVRRLIVVGVMGSGDHEIAELAEPVGRLVARAGHHLLTGGADGVMRAVARAFVGVPDRRGLSIGIVRADGSDHLGDGRPSRACRSRGPNPYVELPIFTHLPHSGSLGKDALSRNHINVLTSNVLVVLPGGAGTASELELAVEYGRRAILFLADQRLGGATSAEIARRHGSRVAVATNEGDVERMLRAVADGS